MSQSEELYKDRPKREGTLSIPAILPLLPVRDIVVYPAMVLPLAVGRDKSIKALEESMATHRLIFLVTQKHIQTEDPGQNDIYSTGTVAEHSIEC